MDIKQVLVQPWIESERGWGMKPDGVSIHISMQDRNSFVGGYDKIYNNEAQAPEYYQRAMGDPEWIPWDALTDKEKLAFYEREEFAARTGEEFRKFGIFSPRNLKKREEWYLG